MNSCILTFFLLVAFCAPACVLGMEDATAGEAVVPPSDLNVGDGCIVQVVRNRVQQKYEGGVAMVNDRWLVLINRREYRTERKVPILSSSPLVGRYFHRSGIGRAELFVWIPMEAAVVQKRLEGSWGIPNAPETKMPPPGANCTVDHLSCVERASTGWMKLEGISGTTLTLSGLRSSDRREFSIQQIFGITTYRQY